MGGSINHRTQDGLFHLILISIAVVGLVVLVIILGILEMAHAFDRQQAVSACTGDVLRLCSKELGSEAKIVDCMKRHRAELSPGCTSALTPDKRK